MSISPKQFAALNLFCNAICVQQNVRFCGIINSMGRLVAGCFKNDIHPLDNDEQRHMLYMQSKLELSMKEEFDSSLGCVNYVVTYRDNVAIINIPLNSQLHVLMSTERVADIKKIVDVTIEHFQNDGIFPDPSVLLKTNTA